MTTCTFDSSLVPSRQITRELMIGSSGAYVYEVEILCRTATHAVYTALAAKTGHIGKKLLLSGKTRVSTTGGTKGTLVLNGVTYTNCYIETLSAAEVSRSNLGMWEFTISFVRHTAS